MTLNTIYENNGQQCCKDLKKMQDQFTKLLIILGNHNIQTRDAFDKRNSNKKVQQNRNIMQLETFGFKKSAAKSVLKYYSRKRQNVPMNANFLKQYFFNRTTKLY